MKICGTGVLVLSVLVMSGVAPRSAPRATGGVKFTNAGLAAEVSFNAHAAHAGRPVKGNFTYTDMDAAGVTRTYTLKITCAQVSGKEATFSGPIVSTNVPAWEGQWVQVWVIDGGTPGRRGDRIAGQFFTGPGCLPLSKPGAFLTVSGGNLTVHKN